MEKRYEKNIGYITKEHQHILLTKTIGVIGCGGIGGYILEFLTRLGVKKIIIFDGDTFEESNLNRQRFSNELNIGISKVEWTVMELKNINSVTEYEYYNRFFTAKDIELLNWCDLIVCAADGNEHTGSCRSALRKLMLENNIPVLEVYGGENGASLRFSTRDTVKSFDEETESWLFNASLVEKKSISQPAYLCGLIAGITVSEIYKYLCNTYNPAVNKYITWNMENGYLYKFSSI